MFSSNKNIESIASLVEELKNYVGLKTEYLRLHIVDKVVRIITTLALAFIVLLFALLIIVCISVAGAFALGSMFGSNTLGFVTMAGIHLLVLLIVFARRKAWIERPLVKFLASILLE